MKTRKTQALWAAVTTMSLSLMVGSASAQDTASDRAKVMAGTMPGHVERADKLIGKEVIGSDNQKLGKINNFVIDLDSGRILYTVISTGGFLGIEERDVAVPPKAFTQTEADTVQLAVDKQKLTDAPQFKTEYLRKEGSSQPSYVQQVYAYFGESPWWNKTASGEPSLNDVHRATTLIGMTVENLSNERIGKVEDLGVDLTMGRAVFAIISPASKLSLGDNYLALPPTTLSWNSEQKALNCNCSNEKLSAAPRFASDNWSNLSSPTFVTQVYGYYGKQWMNDKGVRPTGRPIELQK